MRREAMTDHSGEPVGSLAEELAKLMGVVSGLADQTADDGVVGERDGDHGTEPASDGPDHTAHIANRSEEHTSELQSRGHLVCRLLLEKKKKKSAAAKLTDHPTGQPSGHQTAHSDA